MGWRAVPCDECVNGYRDDFMMCKKCSATGKILVRDVDPYRDLKIAGWINGFLFACVFGLVLWGALELVMRWVPRVIQALR